MIKTTSEVINNDNENSSVPIFIIIYIEKI